jgi:hypothetical protein
MPVPAYLSYYVLGSIVGISAIIVIGLNRGLIRAGWRAAERAVAVQAVAGVLFGWLVLATILAGFEPYRGTADDLPLIGWEFSCRSSSAASSSGARGRFGA